MAWQIRPASHLPCTNHSRYGPDTRAQSCALSFANERSQLSKLPNLRQAPGPTIYKPMVLPPIVSVPLQPTVAPSRPGSAPMIPADKGPSNMGPVARPGYPSAQARTVK